AVKAEHFLIAAGYGAAKGIRFDDISADGSERIRNKAREDRVPEPGGHSGEQAQFLGPGRLIGGYKLATRLCHGGLLKPCDSTNGVGLAERGQRRAKGHCSAGSSRDSTLISIPAFS